MMRKKLQISVPNAIGNVGVIAMYSVRERFYCYFEMKETDVSAFLGKWEKAQSPAECNHLVEQYRID